MEKFPLLSSIVLSKYLMTHRIVTSLSLGLKLGDNTELDRKQTILKHNDLTHSGSTTATAFSFLYLKFLAGITIRVSKIVFSFSKYSII